MNRSDIGRYDPFKVSYNFFSCNPPIIAGRTRLSHLFMGFGRYAAHRAVLPVYSETLAAPQTICPVVRVQTYRLDADRFTMFSGVWT